MRRVYGFAAVCFLLLPATLGCGPGEGTRLVEPTETYQPTEQEQQNQARYEDMRGDDE